MTTDEKLGSLMESLSRQTAEGFLSWQPTPEENTFRLVKKSGAIRVFRQEGYDPDYEQVHITRKFVVLNNSGNEVENYSVAEHHYEVFDNLYKAARRSAYSVDDLLDNLIQEIG